VAVDDVCEQPAPGFDSAVCGQTVVVMHDIVKAR